MERRKPKKKQITCESQRRFELQEQRFNSQEQRSDKLYEMFIDLLKERRRL